MTRDRIDGGPWALLYQEAPDPERALQDCLVDAELTVHPFRQVDPALDRCRRHPPELALLDARGALARCLDLCGRLRRFPGAEHLPVLFLGPAGDPEWIEAALAAGATDAWEDPPHPTLLRRRLQFHRDAARSQRELQVLSTRLGRRNPAAPSRGLVAELDRRAHADGRGQFHRELAQALEQARESASMLAVLLMELDRLPQIRESLGAEAGDLLLQALAERLEARLGRPQDGLVPPGARCARLRGNEFAVLLPRLDHVQDAAKVARLLLGLLEAPIPVADQEVSLTANIGIAVYPVDQTGADRLLRAAAAALSHGREEGRHGFQFCSAGLNATVFERLTLETSLRRALERREFRLHYQPRMVVAEGRVSGLETLIRWQHPDLGLVAPSQFIPVAEETGLILPIGQWALEEACRQARAWRDAGLPELTVAVNLSAEQFRDPGLRDQVAQALTAASLPAGSLELELTESMLMTRLERTVPVLQALKALGCSLAVDDFGTGYSSLSYLKQFPIDCLKLDQSFVQGLPDDPEDRSIATAILRMAHGLGLRVVAEGVATAEQLAFLQGLCCDEIQGYWFSPPLPAAEVPGFLARMPPASERP